MEIRLFDIKAGMYSFMESNLATDFHSHPAIELVRAQSGNFLVSGAEGVYQPAKAVLIKANRLHSLKIDKSACEIILIESPAYTDQCILALFGITDTGEDIVFLDQVDDSILQVFDKISYSSKHNSANTDYRILQCLKYVNGNIHHRQLTLAEIADHVHLSPSRLTHLFKEKVGTSLQKYIIWTRLKYAVDQFINQSMTLTQAAVAAGFYDSAHFSKHFKEFFGLKPSLPYNHKNSRIIQVY
jgi:AraC-like DNA-binding protein